MLFVTERPGPKTNLVVIDGASASGKSTLGDAVASKLGWVHLDTGRVARAFALRERSGRARVLEIETIEGKCRLLLGGEDVSDLLGGSELGMEPARALRDPSIEAEYDAVILDEIARLETTGCVVTARGLGRDLPQALVRVRLETATEVREGRAAGAHARDEIDKERGRLEEGEPGAIRLDGSRSLDASVEHIVGLIHDDRIGWYEARQRP